MNARHTAALAALLATKIHVAPPPLPVSPGVALRRVRACLERLNAPLLDFWAGHARGHLVIGAASGYNAGTFPLGGQTLAAVSQVAAADVMAGCQPVLAAVAPLVDHLLGCDGEAAGGWLSDGSGRNGPWQDVGHRLQQRFRLGYGPTAATQSAPHAWFAWGFAAYWCDRSGLTTTDPLLARLLRDTLFNDAFWRAASAEADPAE